MLGDICKLETAYGFDRIYIRRNGTAKYIVYGFDRIYIRKNVAQLSV